MKKFLLAVALIVSIVASQIIGASQAQAYTPEKGDQAWHMINQCLNCGRRGEQISIYGKVMLKDDCPTAGCPRGDHYWKTLVWIRYIYRSGQWIEIGRDYY